MKFEHFNYTQNEYILLCRFLLVVFTAQAGVYGWYVGTNPEPYNNLSVGSVICMARLADPAKRQYSNLVQDTAHQKSYKKIQ